MLHVEKWQSKLFEKKAKKAKIAKLFLKKNILI